MREPEMITDIRIEGGGAAALTPAMKDFNELLANQRGNPNHLAELMRNGSLYLAFLRFLSSPRNAPIVSCFGRAAPLVTESQ
jgi:hypothetical protein